VAKVPSFDKDRDPEVVKAISRRHTKTSPTRIVRMLYYFLLPA